MKGCKSNKKRAHSSDDEFFPSAEAKQKEKLRTSTKKKATLKLISKNKGEIIDSKATKNKKMKISQEFETNDDQIMKDVVQKEIC